MDRIEIDGGIQLKGKIKISGSKNASLPILAATLLTDKKSKITNVPELADVYSMINLLRSLNANVEFSKNCCLIKTKESFGLIEPSASNHITYSDFDFSIPSQIDNGSEGLEFRLIKVSFVSFFCNSSTTSFVLSVEPSSMIINS